MQKQKAAYKDSGQFEFLHCKIRPTYTFLDFIQGGTEINATIAIDFTCIFIYTLCRTLLQPKINNGDGLGFF